MHALVPSAKIIFNALYYLWLLNTVNQALAGTGELLLHELATTAAHLPCSSVTTFATVAVPAHLSTPLSTSLPPQTVSATTYQPRNQQSNSPSQFI